MPHSFAPEHRVLPGRRRSGGRGVAGAIRRCVGAAIALPACVAGAQPANVQAPEVLEFWASQTLSYDSNVMRLPADLAPAAVTGGAANSRSDFVSITSAGVRFDRNFSLQRVRADAAVHLMRFRRNDAFDNDGYDANFAWDWAYGRQWYGTASLGASRTLASFEDLRTRERNVVDRELVRLEAGHRFTPAWSAIGALDFASRDNSATLSEGLDTRITGLEAGARWEPLSGADWRLLWRHAEGRYPNRQVFDALGDPLPVVVDNAYSEDRLVMRVGIEPSDKTRVQGNVGYTSRRFDTLSERDFGGLTFGIEYTWRPSEVLEATGYALRDIGIVEDLFASYVESRVLGVRSAMLLGGRTTLLTRAEFRKRNYGGDPGFVLSTVQQREDELALLNARLRYEISRKIWFTALVQWERRDSNFARFDFTARTIGATIEIRY